MYSSGAFLLQLLQISWKHQQLSLLIIMPHHTMCAQEVVADQLVALFFISVYYNTSSYDVGAPEVVADQLKTLLVFSVCYNILLHIYIDKIHCRAY